MFRNIKLNRIKIKNVGSRFFLRLFNLKQVTYHSYFVHGRNVLCYNMLKDLVFFIL